MPPVRPPSAPRTAVPALACHGDAHVLLTLLAVASWTPALVGLGSVLVDELPADLRPPVAGVAGLALVAAAGMLANLLVPIEPSLPACLLAVGWATFLIRRARILAAGWAGLLVASAAVALACAVLAQTPERHYDTGLYHLQALEWIRTAPQPRGLANLHDRFGFNVSWFAVSAMLEYPALERGSAYFVGAFPVLFAAWLAVAGWRRVARGPESFGDGFLATAAMASCLALHGLASIGPDDALVVVAVVVAALWVLPARDGPSLAAQGVAAWSLSVFAVTLKLSGVVLPLVSSVLLVQRRVALVRRHGVMLSAVAALLLAPWLGRGLLSSGCLAYPVAASCLSDLPWAVPLADVVQTARETASWARAPAVRPAGVLAALGRRIPYFAAGDRAPTLILLAVTAAAGLLLARRQFARAPAEFWTVVAVSVPGVVFWAATAPDPRFGLPYLLPLAAAPLALALGRGGALGTQPRLALVGCCVAFAAWGAFGVQRVRWSDVTLLRWPALPAASVRRVVTPSGVQVSVPLAGDRCWDAPLPCTPRLNPKLAWRGMFTLASP